MDLPIYQTPDSAVGCQKICQFNPNCNYWTWVKPERGQNSKVCYLKSNRFGSAPNPSFTSGPKYCQGKFCFLPEDYDLSAEAKMNMFNPIYWNNS